MRSNGVYALSPYCGRGTCRDMFQPVAAREFDWQGVSAIDLRADGGRTCDGGGQPYALVHLPEPSRDRRVITLGQDLRESVARATLRQVATRLHVTPRVPGLDGLIASLLVVPPQGGWHPHRLTLDRPARPFWLPTRRQALAGLVAGLLVGIARPRVADAVSASDNFNRADSSPIGGNWTSNGAVTNLVSNAITNTTADDFAHWAASVFAADQDVSLDWVSGPAGDGGPAARIVTATMEGYFLDFGSNPPICKYVAGSFTAIGGTATTPSATNTYRLTVVGTTLSAFLAGVAKGSVTDGAITAAGAPGIFTTSTGDVWDNWAAADIGGGAADAPGSLGLRGVGR